MRVIAGSAGGLKLLSPNGNDTRPTADRVREALFSIIGDDIAGASFLDLFAGTGAVGIEALSRGAGRAVFVDASPQCVEIINKNLAHTRLTDNARVTNADVCFALKKILNDSFDIIYVDPPYGGGVTEAALNDIILYKRLADNGFIITEYGAGEVICKPDGLTIVKEKAYGRTRLIFYLARVPETG